VTDPLPAQAPRARVDAARVRVHLPGDHERGEEMSLVQRVFYRLVRAVVVFIARTYFRVKVIGGDRIPATGAFIVSPVHRSNLDTPVIAAVSRRRLRYMGKESLWKSRFGGWFLTTAGGFPVQRGSADRDALRAGREVLDRGEPLVLFPEGTRQFGPEVQPLFHGAAYLACRTGAPIIPVGIGGSEAAMPKGSKMVYPRKLTLVVGEPLFPPPPAESGRVPRQAVTALTEQLSDAIQVLFDQAQELAGTPNEPPTPER
jgi:1-acyl-sn-glycerol-3-phosphate acyltransferase